MSILQLNTRYLILLIVAWGVSCNQLPSGKTDQKQTEIVSSDSRPPKVPDASVSSSDLPASFSVQGEFAVCQMDSVKIYTRDGFEPVRILATAIEKRDDQAKFRLSGALETGFYLLGQAPNNVATIILGDEHEVLLTGNCNSLDRFGKVSQSTWNENFEKLTRRMTNFERAGSRVSARLMNVTDPQTIKQLETEGREIYQEQLKLLDSVRQSLPFLAKALAAQLYVPYDPQHGKNRYIQQMEGFLKAVDLSDPELERIPMVHEFIGRLAQMLLAPSEDMEIGEQYIDGLLEQIPQQSLLKKNALADIIFSLDEGGSAATVKYAKLYKSTYHPSARVVDYLNGRIAAYESELHNAKRLATGSIPPDIRLPDPNGKMRRLSEYRGKVVLLDFWASWCGPCRKETPNLVKLYNQYKGAGFEIFAVSLDRNKEAWTGAIASDGMNWIQVSDLKYYRSQAALDYQLNFIPANYLLDRDGKILEKNLHGKELAEKLSEIFN